MRDHEIMALLRELRRKVDNDCVAIATADMHTIHTDGSPPAKRDQYMVIRPYQLENRELFLMGTGDSIAKALSAALKSVS